MANLAGVTMLALASLADAKPLLPVGTHAGQLVERVLVALQHQSADSYAELFPALAEFHQAMDMNRGLYGESLTAAKLDFANVYDTELLPEVRTSFNRVLADGRELGIDWSRISLLSWELTPSPAESSALQLAMRFQHEGTTYTVVIDKVLVMHDQVHVSRAIRIG